MHSNQQTNVRNSALSSRHCAPRPLTANFTLPLSNEETPPPRRSRIKQDNGLVRNVTGFQVPKPGDGMQVRSARNQSWEAFVVLDDEFYAPLRAPGESKVPPAVAAPRPAKPQQREYEFTKFGKKPLTKATKPANAHVMKAKNTTSRNNNPGPARDQARPPAAVRHDSTFLTPPIEEPEAMAIAKTEYEPVPPLHMQRPRQIFAGMKFGWNGFEPAEENDMRAEVEKLGGRCTGLASLERGTGNRWLIVNLGSTRRTSSNGLQVVTNYWLERCLDDNRLYDKADLVVFQPLQIPLPVAGFDKLTIGISGYEGTEREHLARLGGLLGAKITENFTKRNTHLLCSAGTDNAKFRKSVEWGIPVVDGEWLYACGSKGTLLRVSDYVNAPERAAPANPTLPADTSTQSPAANSKVPAANVKLGFDTSAVLNALDKPGLPVPAPALRLKPALETPLRISFAKRLGEAAKRSLRKQPIDDIDMEVEMDDPSPPQSPVPVPTPARHRPLPRPHPNLSDDLLHGVVLSISSQLYDRRPELTQMARRMGAVFLSAFGDLSCTHYLYQSSRPNETEKNFKHCRAKGISIVSPAWLRECYIKGQRVKESDYPHFFNPNRALCISNPASQAPPPADNQASTKKPLPFLQHRLIKPLPDKRTKAMESANEVSAMIAELSLEDMAQANEGDMMNTDEPQAPTNYVAILEKMLESQRRRRKEAAAALDSSDPNGVVPGHRSHSLDPEGADSQTQDCRDFADEVGVVVYDDPSGREAKRKFLGLQAEEGSRKRAKLNNETDESLQDKGDHMDIIDVVDPVVEFTLTAVESVATTVPLAKDSSRLGIEENGPHTLTNDVARPEKSLEPPPPLVRTSCLPGTRRAPTPPCSAPKKFLLSGIGRADRVRIGRIMKDLGGIVLDVECWHPEATHLIIRTPARTEKCLAATAAGIWVMQPSYIQACKNAGYFVDEAPYEWTANMDTPEEEKPVFNAPKRWRLKLGNFKRPQGPRVPSFEGWRVLLALGAAKREGFKRLLLAGGAEVFMDPHVFSELPRKDRTYIITDQSGSELRVQAVLRDLAAAHIPFVDSNYCGQYLFDDIPPDPGQFQFDIFGDN
ncbi:hypothetical protein PhCBS80983_g00582 [Powellomyces hirtus]|uniref:BRCT domain-containing protein n=1 Tax=Powellomyces hirtus TaxID=109895 RepID=A0A507EG41_9FUNG|nr:hypothetical protein PhCBS80983_g00582 [Powellomyces hirtus]